jgi:hypothetical protein
VIPRTTRGLFISNPQLLNCLGQANAVAIATANASGSGGISNAQAVAQAQANALSKCLG